MVGRRRRITSPVRATVLLWGSSAVPKAGPTVTGNVAQMMRRAHGPRSEAFTAVEICPSPAPMAIPEVGTEGDTGHMGMHMGDRS